MRMLFQGASEIYAYDTLAKYCQGYKLD